MSHLRSHHISRLIAITLMALSLAACHKSKHAPQPMAASGQACAIEQACAMLDTTYTEWADVYMPVSLSLAKPESFSISGRATMVQGESILLSLRMMGIEAAVVYINSDSAFIVDKYHKYCIAEDLNDILGGCPVTISDMQRLLLGQAFMPAPQLQPRVTAYVDMAQESDSASAAMPLLTALSIAMTDSTAVTCAFDDAVITPAGIAAGLLSIATDATPRPIEASIEWDLDNAKWDTGRQATFKRPGSNYSRIDARALFAAMKQQTD